MIRSFRIISYRILEGLEKYPPRKIYKGDKFFPRVENTLKNYGISTKKFQNELHAYLKDLSKNREWGNYWKQLPEYEDVKYKDEDLYFDKDRTLFPFLYKKFRRNTEWQELIRKMAREEVPSSYPDEDFEDIEDQILFITKPIWKKYVPEGFKPKFIPSAEFKKEWEKGEKEDSFFKALDKWIDPESGYHEKVSQAMRRGSTKKYSTFIENFAWGLKEWPSSSGIFYRGIEFISEKDKENFLKSIKKGSIFRPKSFMSTSKNKYLAYEFTGESKESVLLEIEGKTGKDISSYVETEDEEEVIFLPKIKFRVVDVGKDPEVEDLNIITLKEV